MTMKYSIFGLLMLLALPAAAEVLVIDKIEQAPADIQRPHNGMSMETVRRQFGEPQSIEPAVGDPPITRWDYPGFTVYFEYETVLHSVVHRTPSGQ